MTETEETIQPFTRIAFIAPILAFASATFRAFMGFRLVSRPFNEAATLYSSPSLQRLFNNPKQFFPRMDVSLQAAEYVINLFDEKSLKAFLSLPDESCPPLGWVLLDRAVRVNHFEFLKFLLTQYEKIDLLERNTTGKYHLFLEYLLREGLSWYSEKRLISMAVRLNNTQMVSCLLAQYERMDGLATIYSLDDLRMAVGSNNVHMAEVLFALHEKVGMLRQALTSGHGFLLEIAVKQNNIPMAELIFAQYEKLGFLEEGFWPNSGNLIGLAVRTNSIPMLKLLFAQLAKIDLLETRLRFSCGLLYIAMDSNNIPMVEYLFEQLVTVVDLREECFRIVSTLPMDVVNQLTSSMRSSTQAPLLAAAPAASSMMEHTEMTSPKPY